MLRLYEGVSGQAPETEMVAGCVLRVLARMVSNKKGDGFNRIVKFGQQRQCLFRIIIKADGYTRKIDTLSVSASFRLIQQ